MPRFNKKMIYLHSVLLSVSLCANDTLFDKSLESILDVKTELKAEVGSREGARNFLDSRSPVDVVTSEQIEHSGATNLTEALSYLVSGFNAPSTTVTDGSDHVKSFTLRGMSSDQILVLINGKRVHTSALLHVNATISYGSSHVDLNTIALKAIEKVEILRDGAAAQYGSDAIAGVINIILKGAGHENSISVQGGERIEGDGRKLHVDTFVSIPLKYDGFMNLTLSAESQESTQRAGADKRLDPQTVQTHVGIPESKSYRAVLNAELLEFDDIIVYSHALLNHRDSVASAIFRTPDSERPIYPNGFLPMINTNILDYSFTVGVKGELLGVKWDLSNTYGVNKFNFNVYDTMNYGLGVLSPTSFDNGTLISTQNTTNLDLKKTIDKFDFAGGLEYRYENYEIQSGDEQSYSAGGYSQGFAGYRPENEVDENRNSFSVYFNSVYHFTKKLSLEGALRYEDYSDFGSTSNYKLALGYKVTPKVFFRASGSTGFRAPSLAQSNYSHTSSFTGSDNFLTTQGIFRVDDEISQSLGAKALKAEKSKHYGAGIVYQPSKNISFMLDYFYTDVKDKIMLSNSTSASTPEQEAIFDLYNVNAAKYLTNAVDTKTYGIDLKFNYNYTFVNGSNLDLTLWYNYSKNSVTAFNDATITRENSYKQIDKIENGQPKNNLKILTNYKINDFNIALNLTNHGSYDQVVGDTSYKFDSAWTSDLDVSYKIDKDFTLAIGGTNIFDTMPNKWDGLSGIGYGYDAIFPYSNYSPFGYSGAYYYVKVTMKF